MGDILINQTLTFQAAKNPTQAGAAIIEKEFQLQPAEQLTISDYNESAYGRFNVAASGTNIALSLGTVALGKILVFKPEADIGVKLTNSLGQTQLLTFLGGKTSVLHGEFTGISLTNPSTTAVAKGIFYLAGD
jgi:hypothetical protein